MNALLQGFVCVVPVYCSIPGDAIKVAYMAYIRNVIYCPQMAACLGIGLDSPHFWALIHGVAVVPLMRYHFLVRLSINETRVMTLGDVLHVVSTSFSFLGKSSGHNAVSWHTQMQRRSVSCPCESAIGLIHTATASDCACGSEQPRTSFLEW